MAQVHCGLEPLLGRRAAEHAARLLHLSMPFRIFCTQGDGNVYSNFCEWSELMVVRQIHCASVSAKMGFDQ
jgi:hypothetical protein